MIVIIPPLLFVQVLRNLLCPPSFRAHQTDPCPPVHVCFSKYYTYLQWIYYCIIH